MEKWTLDIYHYTRVLSQKPGGILDSLAFKTMDTKLKTLYIDNFIGLEKDFIKTLELINKYGIDTTFYGPHAWHLDKCKSGILDNGFVVNTDDILVCHFLQLPSRPNAKKVILSCHEKWWFKVGEIKQYWDTAIFLHDAHREYHNAYKGGYIDHIFNVSKNAIQMKKTFEEAGGICDFTMDELLFVSIHHDLGKLGTKNELHYSENNSDWHVKNRGEVFKREFPRD
jgi:hypothetical protein